MGDAYTGPSTATPMVINTAYFPPGNRKTRRAARARERKA